LYGHVGKYLSFNKDGEVFMYLKPLPVFEEMDVLKITITPHFEFTIKASAKSELYNSCDELACINGTK